MAIPKKVRDELLVQARHRCTICSEKCFEIHHLIEQAEGGDDSPENLIVLCPNCHQHRYHRSGEFTRDQLRIYKANLMEKNEVEKRLLQNLEDIRNQLTVLPTEEVEQKLKEELHEAATFVSSERSPDIHASIQQTSVWLAEQDLIRGGARRAIEIEWDIRKEQEKAKFPKISVAGVDNSFEKAPDFPAAYYLKFFLDQTPNKDWRDVFMHEYKNSFYSMKRKTTLSGNRIIMSVADSDNLQAHADYAKRLVEDTNNTVERHVFRNIEQWAEQEKREALKQFDAIQSMKSRVKEIKL